MDKIVISNVNDTERQWDSNLKWKPFEPDGEHRHSFEFQRSTISSPASTKGKLEVYFYTIPPGKAICPYVFTTFYFVTLCFHLL